ncbi:unnamed protein product, partial [Darwinula stevensoni]
SVRESRLARLLGSCISSLTCQVSVLAHVSGAPGDYQETLALVQFVSRIHRLRRRRLKGVGGGWSPGEEGSSSSVDPSSSEQSADTVIYLGPSVDDATDGEHPPGPGRARFPPFRSPAPPRRAPAVPLRVPQTPPPRRHLYPEEQWVDGPRFPRARVLEAIQVKGCLDRDRISRVEQWVATQEQWVATQEQLLAAQELWVDAPTSWKVQDARKSEDVSEDETDTTSSISTGVQTNDQDGEESWKADDELTPSSEAKSFGSKEMIEVPVRDDQVNESELAATMSAIENPLPESDQENVDHPLRALSREAIVEPVSDRECMQLVCFPSGPADRCETGIRKQ